MLVSVRILTTVLSPEEVGNYYLATTVIAFFNLILLNPPGTYFSRHLLEWQRTKNLFNALFVFILWILIVALISILCIYILFDISDYHNKFNFQFFLLFILLSIIISTIHRNLIYGANTIGFRKEFVVFLIITLLIGLLSSVSFVYLFEPTSLYWLFGIIFSEFLVLFSAFRFFTNKNNLDIKKIKITINKERLKKIFFFSFPIAVTTFLMWGQSMSYRFIVDYKYSAEILGYIAVGLGVSSAVFSSLEAIVMQYFSPVFLKDILDANKEERSKAWNKMASLSIPIYILALIFTVAFSKELIIVLVDSTFHNTYTYVMVGASLEFFRVISNLLNNVSQSEHKTNFTIKPYFVGFLAALIPLFIFDFGENILMIPIVLSLAYCIVSIVMYLNMKKLLDIKLEFNFLKVLVLSIPFGLIYLLPSSDSILINLVYLSIFGSYLLLSFWLAINKKYV